VLKILKHLVQKGHDSFKTDLQRRTDEIRTCMSFKGQPDQLHGDTYNAAVRTLAAELMEVPSSRSHTYLFCPAVSPGHPTLTSAAPSSLLSSQPSGKVLFDSSDTGPRSAPGEGPSVIKSSNTGISSAPAGLSQYEATHDPSGNGNGGGRYVGFGSHSGAPPPKQSVGQRIVAGAKQAQTAALTKIDTYRKRDDESSDYNRAVGLPPTSVDSGGSSGYTAPAVPNFRPLGGDGGTTAPVSIDTAYESRLVDEITMPAGVRAAPQKPQLRTFVSQCSSLDSYKIATLLGEKLGDDQPVKTRIRALHVIEALLLSDIAAIADCFSPQLQQIQQLCGDASSSVREMAIRVSDVLQMNRTGGQAPVVPMVQAAPIAVAPTESLLDLGGESSGGSGASGGGMSMFAGLVVKQDGGAAAVSESSGDGSLLGDMMMGGGSASGPPAAAPSGGVPSSMFAGMTIAGDEGQSGAAAEPLADPMTNDPLADLFGGASGSSGGSMPSTGGDLLGMESQPSSGNSFDPMQGGFLGAGSSSNGGGSPLSDLGAPTPRSATGSSSGLSFMSEGGGSGGQGQPMMSGQPMSSQGMGMSGAMQPQGFRLSGTQQQPQQQQLGGFNLSGSTSAQSGFGLAGTGSQQSPLIGGGGGGMTSSGFGLSGGGTQSPMMMSPTGGAMGGGGGVMGGGGGSSMGMGSPMTVNRSNSFGLSANGKSPRKSDDPFSFISTTVTSEANKKS
jgi:hypothetical protein